MQLQNFVYKGFWQVLDWVYPPVCASCGEPGYRICPICYEKINFLHGNLCQICGCSIKKISKKICDICCDNNPPYDGIRSLAYYEGVIRECVHALKYKNNQSLGDTFSELLVKLIRRENWQINFVVPVPLSEERYHERGYNQASLLAKPLAARLSLTFNPYALKRIRHTASQVGLSAHERHQNVIGAFEAETDLVRGKNLLIVDDVMTTGATMKACAQALKKAGAKSAYGVVLARHSS
jgi:ComF family protein